VFQMYWTKYSAIQMYCTKYSMVRKERADRV
jgi:hypothetical protein